MFNFRYAYFIALFAIAFLLVTFPASAGNTQMVNTVHASNQSVDIPSWLGFSGVGGAGAGIGVALKAKIDKLSQNSFLGSSITAKAQDYTNSLPYFKDKLQILGSQLVKINDKIDKLYRRFNYIERQLLKTLDNYQSYDDYKNHRITQ